MNAVPSVQPVATGTQIDAPPDSMTELLHVLTAGTLYPRLVENGLLEVTAAVL